MPFTSFSKVYRKNDLILYSIDITHFNESYGLILGDNNAIKNLVN